MVGVKYHANLHCFPWTPSVLDEMLSDEFPGYGKTSIIFAENSSDTPFQGGMALDPS